MRKSVLAPVICSAALLLSVGGYIVADIYDYAPGILTTQPASRSFAQLEQPYEKVKLPGKPPESLNAKAKLPDSQAVKNVVSAAIEGVKQAGWQAGVVVVDTLTSKVLADVNGSALLRPASVSKLIAAATTLQVLTPEYRFTTSTYLRNGQLYLTGNGDQLLTLATAVPNQAQGAASLSELAKVTADELKRLNISQIVLHADGAGFDTEPFYEGWKVNDNRLFAGDVIPYAVDEGRVNEYRFSYEPDALGRATSAFAQLLTAQGIETQLGEKIDDGRVKLSAQQGATAATLNSDQPVLLAQVKSAPMYQVVSHMLQESDNTLAETLCRASAISQGKNATFAAQIEQAKEVLKQLNLDVDLYQNHDCSGLSNSDRLAPKLLVDLLQKSLDPQYPRLRPILQGLPVSGFSGTMIRMFGEENMRGRVFAKTGSLGDVRSLAGFLQTKTGRTLTFAIIFQGSNEAGINAANKAIGNLVRGIHAL